MTKGSKQENDIKDKTSKYYTVTEHCGLFKPNSIEFLPTDKFRQVWRNHILGESILLVDSDKFKHFTSLTIFPKENEELKKELAEIKAIYEGLCK